jgi:ribosomal protein L29
MPKTACTVEVIGCSLVFEMRVRATTKELENTSMLRSSRRDLARIKMVMAEKRRDAGAGAAK